MNIQCSSCQTRLRVDPTKYTQATIVVQCPNCEQKLRVRFSQTEKAPPLPLQAIVIEEPEARAAYKKSVHMFKNPFSFKGRIRRTEYGLSYMLFVGLFLFIQNTFISLSDSIWYILDSRIEDTALITFILIIPVLILTWFMAAQSAKRCHDVGNSGWFQLIPFYILFLLLKEGELKPNYYGDPAK